MWKANNLLGEGVIVPVPKLHHLEITVQGHNCLFRWQQNDNKIVDSAN